MKKVEFKNEYALHSTANSMLVIADAGFNMEVRKKIVWKFPIAFWQTIISHHALSQCPWILKQDIFAH
ncbi:MAG: hypothetical protein QGI86_06960 [Candidatus Poribacteria bacterium]|jgi:hypothetical protein|nr:hypothetical protein [Candidatus Poribacteria bacterium]MDP6961059.1 hypothetical protein [Dehalococcoidia bacterium]